MGAVGLSGCVGHPLTSPIRGLLRALHDTASEGRSGDFGCLRKSYGRFTCMDSGQYSDYKGAMNRLAVLSACLSATACLAAIGGTATASPAATAAITIDPSTRGSTLGTGSIGLSFEASDLTLPTFTSGNLAVYMKDLGPSVVRIGGNT